MATKKITLNELRTLIKQVIKENQLRTLIKQIIKEEIEDGHGKTFIAESSETFQGNTKQEFMKWARSVFKKRNIPRKKYEYWLDNVDSSPNEWDNSYKGVSQDELIDVHLKAWFD